MSLADGPGRPVPVGWTEDHAGIWILDQTRLPDEEKVLELRTLEDLAEAITRLRVRGAPLIGITAAMGVAALASAQGRPGVEPPDEDPTSVVDAWCRRLADTRPTAVNLAWALERIRAAAQAAPGGWPQVACALRGEADAIWQEDEAMCRRIGEHALKLLEGADTVLTHCNTGALATGGIGTAAAPLYLAAERGRPLRVFVGETRPLRQGARLTAWELGRAGIDVTVLVDGAAGALLAGGRVDAVLVGADRVAANGDVANKVGTYPLAVLAKRHGVPFYVLAPSSTVDPHAPDGAAIPIEERPAYEVLSPCGGPDPLEAGGTSELHGVGQVAGPAVAAWNPAFDVTPADLITAILTEEGPREEGASAE